MGCVQAKEQPLVGYTHEMGAHFAAISGKNIETNSTIIGGVTASGESRMFSYEGSAADNASRFRQLVVPDGMAVWNYTSMVHLSTKEIMITGGLSGNASEISNLAYIYDSIAGRAIRLPNMLNPRYTHISTFFKGKLYVIGGRDYGDDDDTAIQTNCERFNFALHRWEKIAKLNVPRCTGFSFIYKDSIHVCGGLTGKQHRSRVIERYDEVSDKWIEVDFKLARGIECGSLFPAEILFGKAAAAGTLRDSFVIAGGNTEEGSQDTVFVYNLEEKTVVAASCLKQRRVLQKSVAFKNHVVVFGGSETDGIEQFDHVKQVWNENTQVSFSNFVLPEDIDQYAYSQPPIVVSDSASTLPPQGSVDRYSSINRLENQESNLEGSEVVSSRTVSSSSGAVIAAANMNGNPSINNGGIISVNSKSQGLVRHFGGFSGVGVGSGSSRKSTLVNSAIQDENIAEKAYLFGSDIDPFILEIDFLNVRVEKRAVPLAMRLFQHQGVARVTHSPSTFILMGGVHDFIDKSVKYTYSYDVKTYAAKRLPNMVFAAYAFAVLSHGKSIYAIGGKQSSMHMVDEKSQQKSNASSTSTILSVCQRFDCEANEWHRMPNLNVKRVSSMAVVLSNKIFVFGGFRGDSEQVRPNEIEVLDLAATRQVWYVLETRFPIGLEGAQLLSLNPRSRNSSESNENASERQMLVLGGRTSSGEMKHISKLTFEFVNESPRGSVDKEEGSEENINRSEQQQLYRDFNLKQAVRVKLEKVGSMAQSRGLHKVIQPYKSAAIVLGGSLNPIVECVDTETNNSITSYTSAPYLESLMAKLTDAFKIIKDPSLKQYSFAS